MKFFIITVLIYIGFVTGPVAEEIEFTGIDGIMIYMTITQAIVMLRLFFFIIKQDGSRAVNMVKLPLAWLIMDLTF